MNRGLRSFYKKFFQHHEELIRVTVEVNRCETQFVLAFR